MTQQQLSKVIIDATDTMYHVAKTILYSDADCADAIQETIVKSYASIDSLKNDSRAKTWLIRILINECYSILRQNAKVQPSENIGLREKARMTDNDYTDLYEALSRLQPDFRLVLTLYYLEGYRIREISNMLDLSESAVKSRLMRARRQLKSLMEEQDENA